MNARFQLAAEPFEELSPLTPAIDLLARGPGQLIGAVVSGASALAQVAVATLHGFDLQDRPLVRGLAMLPGEILMARSTVALRRDMLGASIVLAFEGGDLRLPVILGMIALSAVVQGVPADNTSLRVRLDDQDRLLLSAEREIVLQCGEASITLTRAGKVLIRGRHILSQSSGYNRIKGAAVDIN